MKQTAVTYVHGSMLHEIFYFSEGTVSPFPRVQWQGRETHRSIASSTDILNLWSYSRTDSN
jgi:hypothetical protein